MNVIRRIETGNERVYVVARSVRMWLLCDVRRYDTCEKHVNFLLTRLPASGTIMVVLMCVDSLSDAFIMDASVVKLLTLKKS